MNGVPSRIGRYTVARALGSGGMGEVYLAYSPAGDPVAVKLIRDDRLDPVARARFEKEALIARTVMGTNRVARFLDADPYAQRPWLAMEYVPGQTLLTQVEAHGPLPEPLVASLGALLSEGLAAVHGVGLLHRDLKPQNVMLGQYGPILIDFGLGAFLDSGKDSLAKDGTVIGSDRCMSPEQANGEIKVTSAADVYGLGAVLLYAATGHYPYEGTQWQTIVGRVANKNHAPDLSALPSSLLPLISGMLAYEPVDRPTLDSVIVTCGKLIADAGMSPARARHMLVDLTGSYVPSEDVDDLSPSLWSRIEAQAQEITQDSAAGESPLDTPAKTAEVTEPGRTPDFSEESFSASSTDGLSESTPQEPVPASSLRPPPASTYVAEELRKQYAMRSTL